MHQSTQISAFGSILLFMILGTAFVLVTLFVSKLISPSKPNPEKLTTYECGENPTGSSWIQFNMRFYVVALVFLLFDVELIFLFPWATVFGNKELIEAAPMWGWLSFFEMTIFIAILLVGLVYVWKKGDLEWIKPKPIIPAVDSKVPANLYQAINESIYKTKSFELNVAETETEPATEKISDRKLFYPKSIEENEIKKQAEESTEPTKPVEAAPYKPKFKPKTVSEPTTEELKDDSSKVETEKPAYKPRFKPQLAKTEPSESDAANNITEQTEKQAYAPKFKPRLAQQAETSTEEQNKTTEEPQTEPVQEKQAYKPRFKPQLVQKTETSIEEQDKTLDESPAESLQEKQAYKPRFKPQLVQKKAEPSEQINRTEEPQSEPTQEKQAYKPKFKPRLAKKQESVQPTEENAVAINITELENPEPEKKEEQPVPATTTNGYKPRFRAGMVKKADDNNKEDIH